MVIRQEKTSSGSRYSVWGAGLHMADPIPSLAAYVFPVAPPGVVLERRARCGNLLPPLPQKKMKKGQASVLERKK